MANLRLAKIALALVILLPIGISLATVNCKTNPNHKNPILQKLHTGPMPLCGTQFHPPYCNPSN